MQKIYIRPCVIGLGYVGLPIFIRLQKKFDTIGFDLNKNRIQNLKKGIDLNKEHLKREICYNNNSFVTNNVQKIKNCNFFIVCVPTPITKSNKPDLNALISSCKILSKIIKRGDIIFFESTVYPGVTENICARYLENKTKLKENKDFFIGYSPERVNPGDKHHSIEKISKIVAYNTKIKKNIDTIKTVYKSITNKVVLVNKIKEAETAKVIENIQRDLNIALFNEIFILCEKLKLNFNQVIKLASTKWNFIKFQPGLVGGHCLPVDPYYLSFIAKKNRFKMSVLLAGRNMNNYMKIYLYDKILEKLKGLKINPNNSNIVILGITYKKNVADTRNSLALEIAKKLQKKNRKIKIFDPYVSNNKNIKLISLKTLNSNNFKAAVVITKHNNLKRLIQNFKLKKIPVIEFF
ncbi:nucleotide sugar dehydrogenase [Candidatus Pelagibacter sp.]|uniref:nucleotide sugar dehydrogenase n=1 Tax=Candidatus Pelagibacter sp. TaxID=2024849 RepID=UPI003F860B8C